MLIHNVECVDYNTQEEQGLDSLIDGIQVVLLPIGLSMKLERKESGVIIVLSGPFTNQRGASQTYHSQNLEVHCLRKIVQ